MRIYKPHEFGKSINRTTSTLQRWDREGRLTAYRRPEKTGGKLSLRAAERKSYWKALSARPLTVTSNPSEF
jgi:predicted site-specific integrase-resolvase